MNERYRFFIMLLLCVGIAVGVRYLFSPPKPVPDDQNTEQEQNPADEADATPPGGEADASDDGTAETLQGDGTDGTDEPAEGTESSESTEPAEGGESAETEGPQIVEAPPVTETEPKTVALDNGYVQVELDNRGAVVSKLRITGQDGVRYEIDLLGYASQELPQLKKLTQPPSLVLSDQNGLKIDEALWRWDNEADASDCVAVFVLEKAGIRFTKTYDITPGDKPSQRYGVRLKIKIEHTGKSELTALNFDLRGAGNIGMCDISTPVISGHMGIDDAGRHTFFEESASNLHGIFSDPQDKKEDIDKYQQDATRPRQTVKDDDEDEPESGEVDRSVEWVAVTNKYFLAALIPGEGFPADRAVAYMQPTQADDESYDERKCSVEAGVRWQTSLPKQGEAVEINFTFLTTSREKEHLQEFADIGMLELVEDGGFFSFVTIPVVAVLKGLHSLGIGYGWAIIILTAVIRIAMFPLSRKQQMLQHKNQRLAPHVKKIKQKYKNDRAKIQQETMKLYSKHGVNPLMGCLPMLIQMPIFIGLFTALRTTIDLRKAAFLYIKDLSIADGAGLGWLLNWDLLGIKTLYYINPLAIGMGLLYFVYMRTMPQTKTDDPQQQGMQKMMKFMPLIMFILLYNYPAGLALYIVCTSIVGMVENRIARKMVEAELERNPIEAPVTPAKQTKKKN